MVEHGKDGWVLEEMDWNEYTGLATFRYSHPGSRFSWFEYRPQPTNESHKGWTEGWNKARGVLHLT